MDHRFLTADVFTDRIFGGNPLAVFTDSSGLDGETMQRIAGEMNLSETVFVLPPDDPSHTARLRIFTPGAELPFAGHPTVGTAIVLAALGRVALTGETTSIVFEEGVGPVPVTIRAKDGRADFAQLSVAKLPEFGPAPPHDDDVAALLSLDPADLLAGDMRPAAVSCGVPFLFVPVTDLAAIGRIRLKRDLWEDRFAATWAPDIFVLTRETELPGSQVHARMFAPSMGIAEDPATGAAAAALGGYLGVPDSTAEGTLRWTVEQGFEMGRPSILEIEADKRGGEIAAVRVGGQAILVSDGVMRIG